MANSAKALLEQQKSIIPGHSAKAVAENAKSAYRNGWISEEKMRELAKPMLKNQYGQYLLKVIDEMKEEINSNTLQHV